VVVDCKALDLLYRIVGGRGGSPDGGGGKGTFGGGFGRDVNSGRLISVRVRDLGCVMILLDDDLKSSSESESSAVRSHSGGILSPSLSLDSESTSTEGSRGGISSSNGGRPGIVLSG